MTINIWEVSFRLVFAHPSGLFFAKSILPCGIFVLLSSECCRRHCKWPGIGAEAEKQSWSTTGSSKPGCIMCVSIGSALGLSCTRDRAKRILLSSAGLISDAYDLFVIDLVKLMMGEIYPMSVSASAAVSLAAIAGALVGQIFWGIAGDTIGRARSFVITAAFVALGSLGSASSVSSSTLSVYTQLVIWRVILGIGVGGDYPLSASLTAGGKTPEIKSVALVFASQGVGRLLACFVNWAVLATGLKLDVCWRISLALGALPTIVTFYWRWQVSIITSIVADRAPRCTTSPHCIAPHTYVLPPFLTIALSLLPAAHGGRARRASSRGCWAGEGRKQWQGQGCRCGARRQQR